jgi:uncharacterized protein YjbI with pentapeptide repeats
VTTVATEIPAVEGRTSATTPAGAAEHTGPEVPTCTWQPSDAGLECTQPVGSSHPFLCILHNPDEGKDVTEFDRAVQAKIDQEETNPQLPQVDLSGAVFPSGSQPLRRAFPKSVNFSWARFAGEADFRYARFAGDAEFRNVRFGGGADFTYTRFGGQAHFWGAEFLGEAAFGGAAFHREANFGSVQFSGTADFQGARFEEDVDFSRSRMEKALNFRHISFSSRNAEFSVLFQDVVLGNAHAVRFEDMDLSRVSFLRTDVSQVHIVGCTWGHRADPLLWPLPLRGPKLLSQRRVVLYDELDLDAPPDVDQAARDRRLVADLYRQLRQNLEVNRQEAEAGHFYIGQMEMRRRDPSYPPLYRLMVSVYRVLAMYGESYLRPPLFYLSFGAIAALFYLWGGFETVSGTVRYDLASLTWSQLPGFGRGYVQALVQALSAVGLIQGNIESTTWWVPAVYYLNMMMGTFLLGFFAVAVGRHFKR